MADTPKTPQEAQAAQAARHTPAVPPTPPPAPTPPAAAAPPPTPPVQAPVSYADDKALVRQVVDGKAVDVTVGELKAIGQLRSAAEKRLHENNQLLAQNRQALDSFTRIRTLSHTDPARAQEEIHKVFGLRPPAVADNQRGMSLDGDADSETKELRRTLAEVQERLAGMERIQGAIVTKDVETQVREAVRELPLYRGDEEAQRRAEFNVATYLRANPGASVKEVAGAIHAQDVEFITRQVQAARDQRAAAVQTHATIPAGAGTPGTTPVEIPKIGAEQMRKEGTFRSAMDFAARLKGMAG